MKLALWMHHPLMVFHCIYLCCCNNSRADGKIKHCRIELDGRLFAIGSAEFESLIDLVKYYEKNPLYNKVKLKIPVSQSLVDSRGAVSTTCIVTYFIDLIYTFCL